MNNSQEITIKKEILVRIIKAFFSDNFEENARLIPYDMRPKGADVPFRCCIHKERSIIRDRVIAGLGFSIEESNEEKLLSTYANESLNRTELDGRNLTVLQDACKGCVPSQIHVTELCQGCVARPCESVCKFGAIKVTDGRAKIDSSICKKCGMCLQTCPYHAIVKITVPCKRSCPVGAIEKDENGLACIDFKKCISCGRCIAACPFGAVREKSQLIDILKFIKSDKKVVAMIAPSIVGQFSGNVYQLKTAIKKVGFNEVVEVAQGADITAKIEGKEFLNRIDGGTNFMTTSCCAGYNQFIKKHLPELKFYVSETKTPLAYTAELVKAKYLDSITVFISPCVAKRTEGLENDDVDYIMSCEELDAFFVASDIKVDDCEEEKFDIESSKHARNFAVSGGVVEAVKKTMVDENPLKPFVINGLNKDSINQLQKFVTCGKCDDGCNFIEVMCCEGGCIAGNATLNNQQTAKKLLNELVNKSEDIKKLNE